MANSPQATKRARQAERRRNHNVARRSMLRTHIKRVVKAIDSGDKDAAEAAYKLASPVIDRVAQQGLIHRNKAARRKSRLHAKIHAL